MARVKGNILTKGVSGTVNKQIIFKQYGDNTIMSNYPDMSKVTPSTAQLEEKSRFARASQYASQQMEIPERKAAYKAKAKGMQRPHNLAVKDFYNSPVIEEVLLHNFSGSKGDTIDIVAIDDFCVCEVKVQIENINGEIVEEGMASEVSQWNWKYALVFDGSSLKKITITAIDLPGNRTIREVQI